jgi:hypothetical protein
MNRWKSILVVVATLTSSCGGHGTRRAAPVLLDAGGDARVARDSEIDATPPQDGQANSASKDANADASAWSTRSGLGAPRKVYAVEGQNVSPRVVALDEQHLYWSDSQSALWRGDREGRAAAEKIVEVTASAGFIVVDAKAVYWTNVGKLVAFDKVTGNKRELPIGRELLAPRVIQDEQNLYVFEAGCRSMTIVPKDGAPADVFVLPGDSSGSVSAAEQDEEFVYCGNFTSSGANGTQSPSVHRRPKKGGPAALVSTFSELDASYNPQIYAIVNVHGTLHVALGALLTNGTGYEHLIYTMPPAGGPHQRVVGPIMRLLQADGGMACDEALSTCYYWSIPGRLLMAYDYAAARVEEVTMGIPADGSGPVQDAQALYWPGRDGIYRQDKLGRPSHAD